MKARLIPGGIYNFSTEYAGDETSIFVLVEYLNGKTVFFDACYRFATRYINNNEILVENLKNCIDYIGFEEISAYDCPEENDVVGYLGRIPGEMLDKLLDLSRQKYPKVKFNN